MEPVKVQIKRTAIFFVWSVIAATALSSSAAEVYEWRDADGVEHMTDTPPPADQKGVVMLTKPVTVRARDAVTTMTGCDETSTRVAGPTKLPNNMR